MGVDGRTSATAVAPATAPAGDAGENPPAAAGGGNAAALAGSSLARTLARLHAAVGWWHLLKVAKAAQQQRQKLEGGAAKEGEQRARAAAGRAAESDAVAAASRARRGVGRGAKIVKII